MGPELIARVLEAAQRIVAATCDAELQAALDGLPAEWSGGTVAWVPGGTSSAAGSATPVYCDGVRARGRRPDPMRRSRGTWQWE